MNPLIVIVCAYLASTVLASGGMLVLQPASGIDPDVLSLVQFGPAIGALITWLLFRAQIRKLWPQRASRRRFGRDLLLAIVASALYTGVYLLVTILQGQPVAGAHALAGVSFVVIVVLQFVGAAGEEIGWRGFLQPILETALPRLVACIVVGVLWGAWHVQIFAAGVAIATGFIASTVLLSILMGYLSTGSPGQRVVVASTIHWLVNIATLVIAGTRTGELLPTIANCVGAATAVVVVLGVLALVRRTEMRSGKQRVA